MGPVCARAAFGIKAPRLKREDRRSADERQIELYPEAAHPVFGVSV
jgi:hypothetical protein